MSINYVTTTTGNESATFSMTTPIHSGTFRAAVTNPDSMMQALNAEEPKGDVEVMVAVFDEPDTHVAVGNMARQIIDHGAFRTWIDSRSDIPVPIFADHGDAFMTHGVARATLKLGRADSFRESADGLVVNGSYNLQKQIARDMYSDLIHDPKGSQWSFRWPPDETLVRDSSGVDHVTRFSAVEEISQVGFGSQAKAHLVGARSALEGLTIDRENIETLLEDPKFRELVVPVVMNDAELRDRIYTAMEEAKLPDALAEFEQTLWESNVRTAIAGGGGPTTDVPWDAAAQVAKLPNVNETEFRKMYAWYDNRAPDPNKDGFPDFKSAYKFPHHMVGADGKVGAANVAGCRAGISALNGARGGTDIPNSDKPGVFSHLASHMKAANVPAPEMKK